MPLAAQKSVTLRISSSGMIWPCCLRTGLSIISAPTGAATLPPTDSETARRASSSVKCGREGASGIKLMPLSRCVVSPLSWYRWLCS